MTNITNRLKTGRQIARTAHVESDKKKLGNLRAGNSGSMDEDGNIAGSCHRQAHLRQLGLEVDPPTDSNLIMFQMGTANESVIYNDLLQTTSGSEVILREEEIPIEWFTSNGTKVTGRPDMVVCRNLYHEPELEVLLYKTHDGILVKPELGIEIKSIASVWTSRDVLFEGEPKFEHLVQSVHYAHRLGDIPWRLIYKQYANQAIPSWANKFFPKPGTTNSEHVEYNDKGEVKNIKPFEIVYEILTDPVTGVVSYRREDEPTTKPTRTVLNVADVARYYEFVSKMAVDRDLGGRPLTITADGSKKSYSKCGYCPLKPACDKHEKQGYDLWLTEVKKQLGGK